MRSNVVAAEELLRRRSWKGSGSTGKAIASAYYLPLYLREQSRTVVE